ncbi:nitrilase 2 [Colletotrichum spaethianum]|uniref:Nitrilase 2 n=1 Tax=Colletotrichum spaethianum TaxID=700344 RepID=A0AA37UNY0_9PEZI|nr:nitrilase 2 [Colletotrichum spaethianum]GKT49500.1 nitrilase 2 [Colletotrichum spaethianum]
MASTRSIVKVAAVQAAPVSFDLEKSLQKLSKLTEEAAAAGADLVVFPSLLLKLLKYHREAFLSAYPWRYSFDTTIGAREPRGRQWFAKYFDSAVEVPSPAFEKLCEIARANNVLLQVGIIEKAGGTLYCTALLLDREGKIVYKHRKLIPTAAERLVWGRGSGDGLQVLQTDVGKIGSLIWLVAP